MSCNQGLHDSCRNKGCHGGMHVKPYNKLDCVKPYKLDCGPDCSAAHCTAAQHNTAVRIHVTILQTIVGPQIIVALKFLKQYLDTQQIHPQHPKN